MGLRKMWHQISSIFLSSTLSVGLARLPVYARGRTQFRRSDMRLRIRRELPPRLNGFDTSSFQAEQRTRWVRHWGQP
jgi:hypothetical protein